MPYKPGHLMKKDIEEPITAGGRTPLGKRRKIKSKRGGGVHSKLQ